MVGLIPTGWYPNSVSLSSDGATPYVAPAMTGRFPVWLRDTNEIFSGDRERNLEPPFDPLSNRSTMSWRLITRNEFRSEFRQILKLGASTKTSPVMESALSSCIGSGWTHRMLNTPDVATTKGLRTSAAVMAAPTLIRRSAARWPVVHRGFRWEARPHADDPYADVGDGCAGCVDGWRLCDRGLRLAPLNRAGQAQGLGGSLAVAQGVRDSSRSSGDRTSRETRRASFD